MDQRHDLEPMHIMQYSGRQRVLDFRMCKAEYSPLHEGRAKARMSVRSKEGMLMIIIMSTEQKVVIICFLYILINTSRCVYADNAMNIEVMLHAKNLHKGNVHTRPKSSGLKIPMVPCRTSA